MQPAEDTAWIFMEPLTAPAGDDELADLARAPCVVAVDPFGARARALAAARRAVAMDRNHAYAHFQLAELQSCCKDLGAFRATA